MKRTATTLLHSVDMLGQILDKEETPFQDRNCSWCSEEATVLVLADRTNDEPAPLCDACVKLWGAWDMICGVANERSQEKLL